jgi:hypothetical protein
MSRGRQEAGGRRQEAGGRRQEAEGRRQEAEGRRQEAGGRRQKAGGRRGKEEERSFTVQPSQTSSNLQSHLENIRMGSNGK